MKTISIANDFSRTPGPRYKTEGDFSGEQFLSEILGPAVREAVSKGQKVKVILDGTSGYGTSFLEESFGGLIRGRLLTKQQAKESLEFQSIEEPYLINDILEYIDDAKASS